MPMKYDRINATVTVAVIRPVKFTFFFFSLLQLPGHGADGRKPLPGDSDGTGP